MVGTRSFLIKHYRNMTLTFKRGVRTWIPDRATCSHKAGDIVVDHNGAEYIVMPDNSIRRHYIVVGG